MGISDSILSRKGLLLGCVVRGELGFLHCLYEPGCKQLCSQSAAICNLLVTQDTLPPKDSLSLRIPYHSPYSHGCVRGEHGEPRFPFPFPNRVAVVVVASQS